MGFMCVLNGASGSQMYLGFPQGGDWGEGRMVTKGCLQCGGNVSTASDHGRESKY